MKDICSIVEIIFKAVHIGDSHIRWTSSFNQIDAHSDFEYLYLRVPLLPATCLVWWQDYWYQLLYNFCIFWYHPCRIIRWFHILKVFSTSLTSVQPTKWIFLPAHFPRFFFTCSAVHNFTVIWQYEVCSFRVFVNVNETKTTVPAIPGIMKLLLII